MRPFFFFVIVPAQFIAAALSSLFSVTSTWCCLGHLEHFCCF